MQLAGLRGEEDVWRGFRARARPGPRPRRAGGDTTNCQVKYHRKKTKRNLKKSKYTHAKVHMLYTSKAYRLKYTHAMLQKCDHPLAGSLPWNQSPAAAMGAAFLGSVTLPVWAQPWYALS